MDENLTADKLARYPRDQILEKILIKAGVISFRRAARILRDTFIVAKVENLTKVQLFKEPSKQCYYLPETQVFITKSSLIYDPKRDQRNVAIREFLVNQLMKGPIKKTELKANVMDIVNCDF